MKTFSVKTVLTVILVVGLIVANVYSLVKLNKFHEGLEANAIEITNLSQGLEQTSLVVTKHAAAIDKILRELKDDDDK